MWSHSLGLAALGLGALVAVVPVLAEERSNGPKAQTAEQPKSPQTLAEEDLAEEDPASKTRRLEFEIEEFPEPHDTLSDDAASIPEEIERPLPLPPGHSNYLPGAPTAEESTLQRSDVQPVAGRDTSVIALDSLDATQVTRLQERLRERGHYAGPIDGIAGPQTRAALQALAREQFELGQRLLGQGQVTTDVAKQLGLTAVDERPVAPTEPPFRAPGPKPASPGTRAPNP